MELTLPSSSLSPASLAPPSSLAPAAHASQLRFGCRLLSLFSLRTSSPFSVSMLFSSLSSLRRFYQRRRLEEVSVLEAATGVSFLMCKVHEQPLPANEVILIYQKILYDLDAGDKPSSSSRFDRKPFQPFLQSSPHWKRWQQSIYRTEQQLLAALGFSFYSLTAASPFPLLPLYLSSLSSLPAYTNLETAPLLSPGIHLLLALSRTHAVLAYPPHVLALAALATLLPEAGHAPLPRDWLLARLPAQPADPGRPHRADLQALADAAEALRAERVAEAGEKGGGVLEAVKEKEEIWGWNQHV
ncbi:hypothetical protein TeGR_g7752 [Tetraparma gracilis]|uniref:Uncharacterized protein n=1 Tax=Tetraparma gracilis TaxID=2962635 RepID=A0ABQ6MUS4_9STRA|nr:hypothetical protein TeGR_g7752 [Tetraparma gracilis]